MGKDANVTYKEGFSSSKLFYERYNELLKIIKETKVGVSDKSKKTFVYLGDFEGADNQNKIQAAIDYAVERNIKTVVLEDKTYVTGGSIIVKDNIKLMGGYNTSLLVYGTNYNVFDFRTGSSLVGLTINIDDSAFIGNVLYFDGKYHYYNSLRRSIVKDITIYDWGYYRKCTGIKLKSRLAEDEISFLLFDNIKLANLKLGVSLEAVNPGGGGIAYINANRFNNLTIEGCKEMINISSASTIPNECTGNIFSNLQIQPAYETTNLFTISGGYNVFDGMIWDLHLIQHSNPVVKLTANSEYTRVNMQNLPTNRVSDLGKANDAGKALVLENRTTDRTDGAIGQMWYRTDTNTIKVVTSTGVKTITPV